MFEILSICKGGGYRYCRTNPPHPKANAKGLYPLHRVLMENKLGRLLRDDEDVHHVDEDKTNDTVGNLEVKAHADHARDHHLVEPAPYACPCGTIFFLKPHQYRLRLKRSKHATLYCSRECAASEREARRRASFGRVRQNRRLDWKSKAG